MNSRLICGPTGYTRKQSGQSIFITQLSKIPSLTDRLPQVYYQLRDRVQSPQIFLLPLLKDTVTQAIGSKSLLGEKREGLTGPTYDSIAGHFLKEDLQSSHPTEDICRVFQGGSALPPHQILLQASVKSALNPPRG